MTDDEAKLQTAIKQRAAEIVHQMEINPLSAFDSIFDAVERALREGMAMRVPDEWRLISLHGQPAPGSYVAIYRDGSATHTDGSPHFPSGLCSYGEWEFYDSEGDDERADDDGNVRGFGWHEHAEDRNDDGYVHLREVVAYYPVDFGFHTDRMKAVRAAMLKETGNG